MTTDSSPAHEQAQAITHGTAAPASTPIVIRPLTALEHLDQAVSIQREVWGYSDLDTDPRAILIIASRFIGQVFGAFDGQRLIGLALAFHASPAGRLHSHRVGVLKEYQNRGIGRELKLAQRADAISRGIEIIQWTFDPLQTRNAHFNLVRLGGIARTYIPNFYGVTSSPLHGGLPTDRLLIEWHLTSPRVADVLVGTRPAPSSGSVQVDLPPPALRTNAEAQMKLRESLQARLLEGYAVTSFASAEGREFYTLEKL